MNGRKILLLEDDASLHETIREDLEEQGYIVISAYDGYEAQDRLYEHRFDLLLLDVNVPEVDGFALLEAARKEGVETPAIFLTARESVDDLEKGFRSGADDYLRKPFALRELRIRIETLLKRSYSPQRTETIDLGKGVHYDLKAQRLETPKGTVTLGRKEGRLLELFLRHPGEILSHERIYDALWEYPEEPSDDSLRTYIKKLRKLLGKERIVSIKKQGYRYVASE